ncbi:hypothetical protein ACF08O_37140 [Streptomyces paradoxus]|uniref:hypothetical protein n=1 Tax=Streptomyces paradoxus TaxID=66375 RepID=UPI003700CEA1
MRPWGIQDVVAPADVCSSWDIPRVMLVIENSWGEPVPKDEIEHYEVKSCER